MSTKLEESGRDAKRLKLGYVGCGLMAQKIHLPAAAIRYVLQDKRIHLLAIGMRLKQEIDANIRTLSGDTTYTTDDRALLAEFSVRVLDSEPIKKMRVD